MPETTPTSSTQYTYSKDGKLFKYGPFDSVEAAIAAATKAGCSIVHVGEVHPYSNSAFFPDADVITDHMMSAADAVAGDYSNCYPDVSEEASAELTAQLAVLLDAWCEKHGVKPSFHDVINITKHAIPKAEMEI